MQQVFGRTTLSGYIGLPAMAGVEEDYRRVRVAVPRLADGPGAQPANDRALVDSYVQASMELGDALERMRGDRDEAQRRLRDTERVLRTVEALEEGQSTPDAMTAVLQLFMDSAGCRRGSVVAPGIDRRVQAIALSGLDDDPFLTGPDALSTLRQQFIPLKEPRLANPARCGRWPTCSHRSPPR